MRHRDTVIAAYPSEIWEQVIGRLIAPAPELALKPTRAAYPDGHTRRPSDVLAVPVTPDVNRVIEALAELIAGEMAEKRAERDALYAGELTATAADAWIRNLSG